MDRREGRREDECKNGCKDEGLHRWMSGWKGRRAGGEEEDYMDGVWVDDMWMGRWMNGRFPLSVFLVDTRW